MKTFFWVAGAARSFFSTCSPSSSGSMMSRSTRLGASCSTAAQNWLGRPKPWVSNPVECRV